MPYAALQFGMYDMLTSAWRVSEGSSMSDMWPYFDCVILVWLLLLFRASWLVNCLKEDICTPHLWSEVGLSPLRKATRTERARPWRDEGLTA